MHHVLLVALTPSDGSFATGQDACMYVCVCVCEKRWRDQMSGDLLALGMKEEWYQLCQDRKEWAV